MDDAYLVMLKHFRPFRTYFNINGKIQDIIKKVINSTTLKQLFFWQAEKIECIL